MLIGVAAVAVVGFIAHQRRTPAPLMELRRFAQRSFETRSVGAFAFAVGDGMALFGSTYLVPVFMQPALHLLPSTTGVVMPPAGIALALTIPLVGRMVDTLPVSPLVATGVLLLAASLLLMMTVSTATALQWIVLWTVIGRIGLGFVLPSLNLGSMRGLPDELISQGASSTNFMRQLGGAVGISLVGIVLAWRLLAQPANPLQAFHETFLLIGAITAGALLAALRMGPGAPAPSAAGAGEPPAS